MDIMKKTKIEQYLQGPLWALLILAFVDIVFFFLDIRCGVILAVSLVVFFSFSDDHLFPKQTRDHQRMYGFYV